MRVLSENESLFNESLIDQGFSRNALLSYILVENWNGWGDTYWIKGT